MTLPDLLTELTTAKGRLLDGERSRRVVNFGLAALLAVSVVPIRV